MSKIEIDGFSLQSLREMLGQAEMEDVSVLNWVRCLGHLDSDKTFRDPRTNEKRTVPKGQDLYMLTSYHYGSDAIWYFGGSRLPQSISDTWKREIKELQKGEEAIFVVRRRIETWEPGQVKFLVFGEHRFELPKFDHGVRLIESLDRQETVSFLPVSLLDCEDSLISDLFDTSLFIKNFDRKSDHCKRFMPSH